MTQTPPAQERYTRCSYLNPQCARFNCPGEDNIAQRSWTGKHKHIERLRCTACGQEFSKQEYAHGEVHENQAEWWHQQEQLAVVSWVLSIPAELSVTECVRVGRDDLAGGVRSICST